MDVISVPNMIDSPYITIPVVINNKNYLFEYRWNGRQELCYLTIYLEENEETIYICKNVSLTVDNNITRYTDYENLGGDIFFYADDTNMKEYNAKTFSDNFYLMFVPKIELEE